MAEPITMGALLWPQNSAWGVAVAIAFACPKCGKQFRVKAELAGRTAKCQCGSKIKIPAPKVATAAASKQVATTSATTKTKTIPPAPAPLDPLAGEPADMGSWLDEELKAAPPVKPTPFGTCRECDAPLTEGAVICIQCGYDTRTGGKHTTEHVTESSSQKKKQSKAGFAMSLARGSLFSFIAAIIGATIWAIIAVMTHREFGLLAWGLGGLCGFGMALGHDDDDGTMAGIIAAGMSIFAIIASKILIAVIFFAMLFSQLPDIAEEDFVIAPVHDQSLSIEKKRAEVAEYVVEKRVEMLGEVAEWPEMQQVTEAVDAEIAQASDEEIAQMWEDMNALENQADEDSLQVESGAEEEADWEDAEVDLAADEEAVGILQALGGMFGIMDGLFILLACGTAYKLGSGQMTD